jgi:hypothetical protein
MARHPFARRRCDVPPNTWTRWKLDRVRDRHPGLNPTLIAAAVGIPRNALYDWQAGRRTFGPRRLARLDRWCRPLL